MSTLPSLASKAEVYILLEFLSPHSEDIFFWVVLETISAGVWGLHTTASVLVVLLEHKEYADGLRSGNCRQDCGLDKPLQIGHILEAYFRTGLEPRSPGSWLRRLSQCTLMSVSCLQRTGWWHVWTKCEKSQKELSWPLWARWPAVEDPWSSSCLAEPGHSSIFL